MRAAILVRLTPLLLVFVCGLSYGTSEALGAGASFPAPVYTYWAKSFEASQKVSIAYESVGSGEGVKRISERAIEFGASDTALSTEELKKLGESPRVS